MRASFLRSSLMVAAGLSPAAAAQETLPKTTSLAQSHGLQQEGNRLRGGGADYRVVFSNGAMEFTPALGSKAPRTQTLRLRAQHVRRGLDVVAGADGQAPAQRDGNTVSFVHPGFVERYQVRPEGVELSLVFERRPAGDGDLIVAVAVETGLALRSDSALEVRYADGELGGVRIGGVTGIAADGRRQAGALRLSGAQLELVLPQAFVDAADYPLVVDPLISTDFTLAPASSWSEMSPDAAYDEGVGQWLVAWQRSFSSGDAEIRCQRVNILGGLVGTTLFLTATAGHAAAPTVASTNLSNRYLVAWQQAPTVFGQYDIYCAAVNLDGTFTAAVPVATTASDEVSPQAAGEFTNVDDDVLLVWWAPGAAMACQISLPAGTGNPVPFDTTILYAGTVGYGSPRISKSGGGFGWFMVVFDLDPWAEQIAAVMVDRELSFLVSTVTAIETGNGVINPDLDGDGVFFHIVYERDNGANGVDVFCRKVRFDQTTPPHLDTSYPPVALDPASGTQRDPTVGFLGHKYAAAWIDDTGFLTSQIVMKEIDPVTCGPCGPTSVITGSHVYQDSLQIATQYSNSAGSTDGAILLFASAANAPPFNSAVECQLFEEFAGGAVNTVAPGCGQGGVAGSSGAFSIGNSNFAFTLSGGPPSAAGAVFVASAPGAPIVCGACTITPPTISFGLPYAGGSSSLPVPVPCDPNLVGGTLEVQWWVVGTPSTPCGFLAGLGFSNRLHATIGY
jgi:hypothetical protein